MPQKLSTPRSRLSVEQLEDRLVPSWGNTPPPLLAVPLTPTRVLYSRYGDSTGQAAITNNEVDWYAFTTPVTGSYHLSAWSPEGKLDTVLSVYNRLGQRLAYNDDVAEDDFHSAVDVNLLAGRTYYFGVTNFQGTAGGSYSWYVDSPVDTTTDDLYEENDIREEAYDLGTLAGTRSVTGLRMADDADWFQFTMTGTGTAAHFVSVSFQDMLGDLDLRLYNANGLEVGSAAGTGNAENISLAGLAAGTYYVEVFGYEGASNPNYSLTINPATSASGGTNAWTVFIYLTASDLQRQAFRDINEMEYAAAQLPANVKLVLLWDQSLDFLPYATARGAQQPWGTVGRAVVTGDTNMTQIATPFEILPEADTGDPATLSDFLRWGAQAAPAAHYSFINWSHGGGLYGSSYDDADGLDPTNLTVSEMASALAAADVPPIDVMAYDACLMGMTEVAYTLRNVAPVFAGTEELINVSGHDYRTLFKVLRTNPHLVTPEQLGAGYVASFGLQYVGTGTAYDTYSAIRTTPIHLLTDALRDFVDATAGATNAEWSALRLARNLTTRYDGYVFKDFRDLGSFMRNVRARLGISLTVRTAAGNVLTALSNVVIAKTRDYRASSGLAIYLPRTSIDPNYATDYADFNAATGWDTFVTLLLASG